MKKLCVLALLSVLVCLNGVAVAAVITTEFAAPMLCPPVPGVTTFFVVATNGSDSNPGTVASPFLTLGKCQTAMQGGSTKTCYIRSGSYAPPAITNCDGTNTCALKLTSSDNGEIWSCYPSDRVDTADITGGSTSASNGMWEVIDIGSSSNIIINGLSIHDFIFGGIVSGGGASSITIENNLIFNGYFVVTNGPQNAAGFTCYGCANTIISHNVVHDIASFGISATNVNGDISNYLVTGNVLYNICTGLADCGAIYAQDVNATATDIRIMNNFIRDGNTFATLGSGFGSAIYMDDCLSNTTASGNIITGRNGSNTTHLHGGNSDHYIGNLIDLVTYQQHTLALQTSSSSGCSAGTMSGNQFENNILISSGGGGGYVVLDGSPVNAPTITGNAYHNYAGSAISSTGDYSDANPTSEDPQLSGWMYSIAAGSPAFNSPVNFTALVKGWGPPGYVMPTWAPGPSSPH